MCWQNKVVSPDDHEKWMARGGVRQWAKRRKRDYLERGEAIERAMGWKTVALTNYYCRLRGRKGIGRWWGNKVGHVDKAKSPRYGEEAPDHIVFQSRRIKRVKDVRGRGEWARGNGMRWDS